MAELQLQEHELFEQLTSDGVVGVLKEVLDLRPAVVGEGTFEVLANSIDQPDPLETERSVFGDESGAVIAEAKAEKLKPYLGLHYPASDIPKQARDLYLRNRVRLIPDADYAPAPLRRRSTLSRAGPLDLSHSVLRSVSPVHVEYLHNMGVAASMSLSLVIDGKLWGLIACHHRTPLYLDQAVRSACELFAQMVSLQLAEKLANEAQAERLRMQDVRARLVEAMVGHRPFGETLIKSHPNLMDYIAADGVVVWWEGKRHEARANASRRRA